MPLFVIADGIDEGDKLISREQVMEAYAKAAACRNVALAGGLSELVKAVERRSRGEKRRRAGCGAEGLELAVLLPSVLCAGVAEFLRPPDARRLAHCALRRQLPPTTPSPPHRETREEGGGRACSTPGQPGSDSGSETDAEEGGEPRGGPRAAGIRPLPFTELEARLELIRPYVVPPERERPEHDMTRALGGIFISGMRAVAKERRIVLHQAGVSHVVSCSCSVPRLRGFYHLKVDIDDAPQAPIMRALGFVVEFLRPMGPAGQALIHCQEGVNRSAAIAVALRMVELMRCAEQGKCQVPQNPAALLQTAWSKVANHRGCPILTNPGFQRQLLLYAHLLTSLGSSARWPSRWGPEVWLRSGFEPPLDSEELRRCRRLRARIEEACLESGMCEVQAMCTAARTVLHWLRRGRLR